MARNPVKRNPEKSCVAEPLYLFRYPGRAPFQFNNRAGSDGARSALALKGIINKRLAYAALSGSEFANRTEKSAPHLRRCRQKSVNNRRAP
jgi:hypothetical protein